MNIPKCKGFLVIEMTCKLIRYKKNSFLHFLMSNDEPISLKSFNTIYIYLTMCFSSSCLNYLPRYSRVTIERVRRDQMPTRATNLWGVKIKEESELGNSSDDWKNFWKKKRKRKRTPRFKSSQFEVLRSLNSYKWAQVGWLLFTEIHHHRVKG